MTADAASDAGSVHARIKDLRQRQAGTGGRLNVIDELITAATNARS